MLTTVAALVIILGLMVSLARHVRSQTREDLTRGLLARLEKLMADNADNPRLTAALAKVTPLVPARNSRPDDAELTRRAYDNSKQFVAACREALGPGALDDLPLSLYDGGRIRDAWGTPVVYMAPGAFNIDINPQGRAFFVSSGPDQKFSTVLDNLYSYERGWDESWNR
jgi:hypothetical protein